MTTRLDVVVSFSPEVGYISEASARLPRSLTALSLDRLRRRIIVALLSRRGTRDQPVAVHLDLDAAAQAEAVRRRSVPPSDKPGAASRAEIAKI